MNVKFKAIVLGFLMASGIGYVSYAINQLDHEETVTEEAKAKPVKNDVALTAPHMASSQRALAVTKLELTANNTVVFRTDFNAISVAAAQQEMLRKNHQLKPGAPLYLVLDTPGGSIPAGNALISLAQSLGRPVHTITIFAASMGFNTAQQLGKRYILPEGNLMAHRARVGGVGGQVPGEFLTAAANIVKMVNKFEAKNAQRMGISVDEYTLLVKDEYWAEGEDAVRQGAADELASISCDASLSGTHSEQVATMFGVVNLIWDNCPAITAPVGYSFNGPSENEQSIRNLVANYHTAKRGSKLSLEY